MFWALIEDTDSFAITINQDLTISLTDYSNNAILGYSYALLTDKWEIEEKLRSSTTVHTSNTQYSLIVYNKSGRELEMLWIDYQGNPVSYSHGLNG